MNKSELFKSAWSEAQYCESVHGGKAKEYFSECLKKAYIISKISGASYKQKEYAASLASNALFTLSYAAGAAKEAGKDAFANAALDAIGKINKIKNASQMIDSLKDVNFHKGHQLKEWHSKN